MRLAPEGPEHPASRPDIRSVAPLAPVFRPTGRYVHTHPAEVNSRTIRRRASRVRTGKVFLLSSTELLTSSQLARDAFFTGSSTATTEEDP